MAATTGSMTAPYGTTTAVRLRVSVAVTVADGVSVLVTVAVLLGVEVWVTVAVVDAVNVGVTLAVVVCVALGGGGVSVITCIPCMAICVATNESLVAP
jgi:uncharacterized membrane protein YcjF (UPF0283 family)